MLARECCGVEEEQMASSMVDVTVKVPDDGIPDFYVMYGEWLGRWEKSGVSPKPAGWTKAADWTSDDGELAVLVWQKLPARSRILLDLLVTKLEMTPDSIVAALGLKDFGQLTGVNGWVGRVSNQFGRKTPIKPKLMRGETVWTVEPAIAELFRLVKGKG
jgi:hypothetical protein